MINVAFKLTVINHRWVKQTYRLIVWAHFTVETADVTARPSEIDLKQQSESFSDKSVTFVRAWSFDWVDRYGLNGRMFTQSMTNGPKSLIINSCLHVKKQLGQSLRVCLWNERACDAKEHPLVELRVCGYSYELRGLLHCIKELVVVVLVAGLTFSSSCRTFKWKQN